MTDLSQISQIGRQGNQGGGGTPPEAELREHSELRSERLARECAESDRKELPAPGGRCWQQ